MDRVDARAEHDRNGRGRRLCCERSRRAAGRDDDGDPALHQIGRQFRQPIDFVARPAELDSHVLPLDVAGFAEAFAERGQEMGARLRRAAI
jgi:hypothetical protein